jgi:hypothetical protein
MYGMIHRAIFDFLSEQYRESEWDKVKSSLNVEHDSMISTLVYPDSQTMQLVEDAAMLLGISTEEFLRRLGRFWVMFSERGAYRRILDFAGEDLASFIQNLDRMHQAVVSAMPRADVPSFTLVDSRPGELVVDYRSNRNGLEAFVIGLLQGLLDRFKHDGCVTHESRVASASRFVVRYA